jgi:predicted branched-subunit amino acid permease
MIGRMTAPDFDRVACARPVSSARPPDRLGPVQARLAAGIRRGLPFGVAVFAIAISFGVLARPVMGSIAPIVMSILVFSGAAQFGSLAILAAGGGAGAAIAAGVLLNARYLAMGFALAPSLRGSPLSRAAFALTTVDASWAAASIGDGAFDPWYMVGVTVPQYPGWVLGTIVGVLTGSALGDPRALGPDALFPAFFVALLFEEARGRRRVAAAGGGAGIALALTPFAPAGLPILAAAAAAVAASRMRP